MNDWFAHKIIGLPELDASTGQAVDNLIVYIHYLMAVLLVGWTAYFFYVLWRFGAKRNPKADYDGSKSHLPKYSEIMVVGVEMLLLFGFAIPLWGKNVEGFPGPDQNPTYIQIMAQQFAWNARYPGPDGKFGSQDMKLISNDNIFGVDTNDPYGKDDFQVLNEIHVPVNQPVVVYLSSKDVIHSFKLLAMRITQDAIPGLRIPFSFTPTKIGIYQIECAQLCGNGHAAMAGGRLVVQSPEDYKKWFNSKSNVATPASFQ